MVYMQHIDILIGPSGGTGVVVSHFTEAWPDPVGKGDEAGWNVEFGGFAPKRRR